MSVAGLPGVISNATQLEGVGHKRILMLNVGAQTYGSMHALVVTY